MGDFYSPLYKRDERYTKLDCSAIFETSSDEAVNQVRMGSTINIGQAIEAPEGGYGPIMRGDEKFIKGITKVVYVGK